MKKRSLISIAVILAILLILSGCGSATVRDLMVRVQAAERPANPAESGGDFIDSIS